MQVLECGRETTESAFLEKRPQPELDSCAITQRLVPRAQDGLEYDIQRGAASDQSAR